MIIVTGATGQLGSQIVDRLLERVPASGVGVSVRDPGGATGLAQRGVRVRAGDYARPETLAAAFEGASQVLLISSNSSGDQAVAQHRAAITAARDAGAQRVLYTSHQASSPDSLFAPMRDHADTERQLGELGVPFTSLRNGFYASTVPRLLGRALETGELAVPADGPVSWTAHADLAELAAAVLLQDDRWDGVSPALTAPAALDFTDIAGVLSELSGRTIRRVVVDDEEWVAGLTGHGVPDAQARMLLGLFLASRRGEFATTDPTLETVLGHPATSVRTLLEGVLTPS